jgi:uncharacterized HAD superfamily protein
MRIPQIYVDIDDVLAETTRALAELARQDFGKDVDFEDLRVFDLSVSLGLDEKEFPRFMAAAHAPDFLLGLEPVMGARETLAQWSEAGARIHLITGRPPATEETTRRWLEERAIPHERLEFVDKYGRHPECATTSRLDLHRREYDFCIEDSHEMARELARHSSGWILLFDRPWNRRCVAGEETEGRRNLQRVRDWAQIRSLAAPLESRPSAGRKPVVNS